LSQAWITVERLLDRMSKTRREEFKNIVSKILRDDKSNFFAYEWQAKFQTSDATSPTSPYLKRAAKALKNALRNAPGTERGRIYRALAKIQSCIGNHEEAIDSLRKARSLRPDNIQINLDLAMLHMRMGEKYFVMAAEEIDQIPKEIGDEKYVPLAYIRSFLGETEKASKALQECSKFFKPLVHAHILLIQEDKQEAIKIAKKRISTGDTDELANWAELLLCSGEFGKAVDAINTIKKLKSKDEYTRAIEPIFDLANFFLGEKKDFSEDKKDILSKWSRTSWNFREMLIFRERAKRAGKEYGGRIEIIEELIREQELREIKLPLISGRVRRKLYQLRSII